MGFGSTHSRRPASSRTSRRGAAGLRRASGLRRAGEGGRRAGVELAGAIARRIRPAFNFKLLLGLVALWIVYEGLISTHSVVNLYKFGQERDQLKQDLAAAEARRDSLKTQLDRLESDDFIIEKLAREKLGLAREGEIIYRYEQQVPDGLDEAPLTPPIFDEGEEPPEQPERSERPPDSEEQ